MNSWKFRGSSLCVLWVVCMAGWMSVCGGPLPAVMEVMRATDRARRVRTVSLTV